MEALAGPVPHLREWNLQRCTAVPLRGRLPSVLLSFVFLTCFFNVSQWQKCDWHSSGMRSMSSHTEAGCWPHWPLGTAVKRNQVCIWNPCKQPSASVCNCVQPSASHLTPLYLCPPPPTPPHLSSSVRRSAISQKASRTQLMHSTWIKDLVAGHSASDMSRCC